MTLNLIIGLDIFSNWLQIKIISFYQEFKNAWQILIDTDRYKRIQIDR